MLLSDWRKHQSQYRTDTEESQKPSAFLAPCILGAFRPLSVIQAQVFKYVAEELHILLFLLSGLENL